jgi:hypothetical protein
VVVDSLLKLTLKLLHRFESTVEDVGVDGGKISFTFLELADSSGDELISRHRLCEVRDKESGKCDVKRKDRFNAVSHIKGGVSGQLLSHSAIGPECIRGDSWPLRNVAFTSLDN